MIYHLFEYLTRQGIALPFSRLFTYVSFRVGLALIVALLISTIWGSKVIDFLRRKQIGELVRDLGLEGEQTKKGTPTMGGSSSSWRSWCLRSSLRDWTISTSS